MYGTLSLLVTAYLIRFMPVAVIAQEASFQHLSPLLVDVSKSLGASTLKIWWRILLPLIRSGLVAGWIIAFVDMMKELPATLMLRPLAFDTLAVRVWIEASESLWEMASVPALMIVLVSLLPVILLVRKTKDLCKSFC
ncbi:MAG: ABC transporter permease subunit [Caldimicrobium sp.]|nr:ABC transporter permease subunit [Caldimicrobium sp.]MDW8182722.1 ABC transporter permease subunit [Caldimicrobium sp.]